MEDQQKINQFARLNNRLEELKDDIKSKRNEIQTLKDAKEEIELLLLDDDEKGKYVQNVSLKYTIFFEIYIS